MRPMTAALREGEKRFIGNQSLNVSMQCEEAVLDREAKLRQKSLV